MLTTPWERQRDALLKKYGTDDLDEALRLEIQEAGPEVDGLTREEIIAAKITRESERRKAMAEATCKDCKKPFTYDGRQYRGDKEPPKVCPDCGNTTPAEPLRGFKPTQAEKPKLTKVTEPGLPTNLGTVKADIALVIPPIPDQPATLQDAIAIVFHEMEEIFAARHHDYGPGNIMRHGELGVVIRAHDKMERLNHLLFDLTGADPKSEPIEDAWVDLGNYAIIALLVRRGWWGLPFDKEAA